MMEDMKEEFNKDMEIFKNIQLKSWNEKPKITNKNLNGRMVV
jgi:hypothetical protein